jgi:hypothetical protein
LVIRFNRRRPPLTAAAPLHVISAAACTFPLPNLIESYRLTSDYFFLSGSRRPRSHRFAAIPKRAVRIHLSSLSRLSSYRYRPLICLSACLIDKPWTGSFRSPKGASDSSQLLLPRSRLKTQSAMQVDVVHANNEGNSDDDSLFGSPPSSPVRGRSPALALPSGGNCTQNVGTIALPGSHLYSELPVNTPALSLRSSSHNHELSQRPPAQNSSRMQSRQPQVNTPQAQAPSVRSNSSQSLRRGGAKKKSSRENSTAPRPPPPPIHLPDPDAPPPPHFLRNQQALLGLAGLVGRVHPANLAIQRSARGSNPSNPIVVEDVTNPPPLGRQNRQSTVDFSKLPPPSNEEIVASLIKDKNVFPVLESILKLIAGNAFVPQNRSDRGDAEQPNSKRRKVDTVPAGAVDWDVPYPFPNGGGPTGGDWERERGKQLIAQLVGLIKGAARKAALKSYQHQSRLRQQSYPHWQQPQPVKDDEPKIRGHYRPRTANYGRADAQAPEVLADQSNINGSVVPLSCEVQPSAQSLPLVEPATQPFGQMLPSLLTESPAPSGLSGDDGQSVSEWSGGLNTPSETSAQDFDQNAFDSWMSILNAFPNPPLDDEDLSSSSNFCHDIDSFMSSISNNFPMHSDPNTFIFDNFTQSNVSDDFTASSLVDTNFDFSIDPVLLAMSMPPSAQPQFQQHFDPMSSLPALVTSPIESPGSSADPLTPHVDMAFNDPDIFADQQGMSIDAAQDLFVAEMVAMQDPLLASGIMLRHASAIPPSPSSDLFTSTITTCLPVPRVITPSPVADIAQQSRQQTHPRVTPPAPTSRASSERTTAPAPPQIPKKPSNIEWPLRPMRALNKQDVLSRAKERRRQLVGEIDRAKVELWETTIEQGVLAQLVKENL